MLPANRMVDQWNKGESDNKYDVNNKNCICTSRDVDGALHHVKIAASTCCVGALKPSYSFYADMYYHWTITGTWLRKELHIKKSYYGADKVH